MISSAVPTSARVLTGFGSSAVIRNTTQVTAAARAAAARMPILASASWSPRNASDAISSETVKPMPALAPPPVTAAQPTGGRSRRRVNTVTNHDTPRMPTGLPTT